MLPLNVDMLPVSLHHVRMPTTSTGVDNIVDHEALTLSRRKDTGKAPSGMTFAVGTQVIPSRFETARRDRPWQMVLFHLSSVRAPCIDDGDELLHSRLKSGRS